jgi:FkbM family methyltransferase
LTVGVTGPLGLIKYLWAHPANKGRRAQAFVRLAIWQAWQRVVRRPLNIRVAGGLRMRCYPHSHAAALVWYCGLPEWEHMRFVQDFLRPGDCFVDVGANVGTYSLLAAAVAGVEIVAFEPSSEAFQRLDENIAINGLESRVSTRREAIGAAAGTVMMSVGKDAINHVVVPGETSLSEKVAMVSLDDALEDGIADRLRLIKVDVEGFEEQVLRGAISVLAAARPALIVEANDPAAIRDILVPLGYQSYAYDPTRCRLRSLDWLDIHDNNLLAIHERAFADARLAARGDAALDAQPGRK